MSAPTEEQALAFAKYHAEHAAHGGAGREFHLRAETFLLELARVSAERDAAVKERDTWMARADEWGKIVGELNQKFLTLEQQRAAALGKVKALEEAVVALPAHDTNAEQYSVSGAHLTALYAIANLILDPCAALASEVPPQPTTRVALTTPTDKEKTRC